MECKSESVLETLQNEFQSLSSSKLPDNYPIFFTKLSRLLTQSHFQLSLFQNFSDFFDLFLKFSVFLLTELPLLYTSFESLILDCLLSSCVIVSNFGLILLISISSYLPISRVNQISEYFCEESLNFSGVPIQYLRYLAFCSDLKGTFNFFFNEKKFENLSVLAFYSEKNESLFEVVRERITAESPSEMHYSLIRFGNKTSNVLNHFKNFASRLWILHNTHKLKSIDCLCLLQYSALKCVRNNINDLEVLKSVIFALNSAFEFASNGKSPRKSHFIDFEFEKNAKICVKKIKKFQVPEKFEKKFREVLEKLEKVLEGKIEVSVEVFDQVEEGKKLCKDKIEILGPIRELQQILGIKSNVNLDNEYNSAVKALEEITDYIKISFTS